MDMTPGNLLPRPVQKFARLSLILGVALVAGGAVLWLARSLWGDPLASEAVEGATWRVGLGVLAFALGFNWATRGARCERPARPRQIDEARRQVAASAEGDVGRFFDYLALRNKPLSIGDVMMAEIQGKYAVAPGDRQHSPATPHDVVLSRRDRRAWTAAVNKAQLDVQTFRRELEHTPHPTQSDALLAYRKVSS